MSTQMTILIALCLIGAIIAPSLGVPFTSAAWFFGIIIALLVSM